MPKKRKFTPLKQDEIVSIFEDALSILISHPTFKVSELIRAIINLILSYDNVFNDSVKKKRRDREEVNGWWNEGIQCQVLTHEGKGWQNGKVRLTLEFCPDDPEIEETSASNESDIPQPESPLDDLRQRINQDNQSDNQ
ncbi:MAG: KGK domain-containing protein [Coleofasciculus chthonoplastes F3-SA18-01]|uniref:KGK domain-containing protein n=1 Tax=Coleofasciculus chthonoplastes TaxID=64178 RepID=UPI0032F87389